MKNDQRNTCTEVTSIEIMIRHTIASLNYCDIVVLCSLINYVLWSSASPLNGMDRATYAKARPGSPLKLIGFSFCIPFSMVSFGISPSWLLCCPFWVVRCFTSAAWWDSLLSPCEFSKKLLYLRNHFFSLMLHRPMLIVPNRTKSWLPGQHTL